MKRSYESYGKVIFIFFVFIVMIILVTVFLVNRKIISYKVFSGVVYNDNLLTLTLRDSELKYFNKNQKIFIDNKGKKFKIDKVEKNVFERVSEKYNQVFIKVDISDMYEVGDIIEISIMEKNIRSYKIFNIIWEGE